MNFLETMGVCSDSSGQLLFYTNGTYIANVEHDTMKGGGPMNPGYWADVWTSWGDKGYRTRDGIIVLPDLNKPNHYRLFHICASDSDLSPDKIMTTLVDMHGDGAERASRHERSPRQGHTPRAPARLARDGALARRVDQLGVAHARGHERAERREQGDVVVGERVRLALHHERPVGPGAPADRHREEHGEAVLFERVELLVGAVAARVGARHRPQVLHALTRHALAHLQAHLPHGRPREADVAAHDEGVTVAFDQVERAHGRVEDLGDAPGPAVEQRHQGHGLGREREKVEDSVEPWVAPAVDLALRFAAHDGEGVWRAVGLLSPAA